MSEISERVCKEELLDYPFSQQYFPKPPAILYKYMGAGLAKQFFNCPTVRYTPFMELNDPFDANPSQGDVLHIDRSKIKRQMLDHTDVKGPIAVELLVKYISEGNYYISADCLREGINICLEEYCVTLPSISFIDFVLNKLELFNSESYREKRNEHHRMVMTKQGLGILCLSVRNDSALLWSYYCDKHQGFVVSLKSNHPYFATTSYSKWSFKEVEYSPNRAKVTIPPDAGPQIETFLKSHFTKKEDWSHEAEWRQVVFEVQKLDKYTGNDGSPIIGVDNLPIEAIDSIIIGLNTKSDLADYARHFCDKYGIQLQRTRMDLVTFDLHIDNC